MPLAQEAHADMPVDGDDGCYRGMAAYNHLRWPDGLPDGITRLWDLQDERDREGDMLAFLRRYTTAGRQ